MLVCMMMLGITVYSFFFFKQKTAYEMRISDWSSDVCSSDLVETGVSEYQLREAATRDEVFPLLVRAIGKNCRSRYEREEQLPGLEAEEIGRASCRERVCQYV